MSDSRGQTKNLRRGALGQDAAPRRATWAVRIAFFVVFVLNVQCAVVFLADPASYMTHYQLTGVPGMAAVRGLGIAFLMWNATYPAFIAAPNRWPVLGWVILAQQVIGLVGESLLLASLPAGYVVLAHGIRLFIVFDGCGLVLMVATFAWWTAVRRRTRSSKAEAPTTEECHD